MPASLPPPRSWRYNGNTWRVLDQIMQQRHPFTAAELAAQLPTVPATSVASLVSAAWRVKYLDKLLELAPDGSIRYCLVRTGATELLVAAVRRMRSRRRRNGRRPRHAPTTFDRPNQGGPPPPEGQGELALG